MAPRRMSLIHRPTNRLSAAAERFAGAITLFTGSTTAFVVALAIIVLWALSGPLFGYSDTWQLVINTGTTIVTFLMVFLIQRTQNKDALAMQLKLNEIVAVLEGASNQLISVEDLTEDELRTLNKHYERLAKMAKQESNIGESHSIEEAMIRHERKKRRHKSARS